jgi:hypothetical protein
MSMLCLTLRSAKPEYETAVKTFETDTVDRIVQFFKNHAMIHKVETAPRYRVFFGDLELKPKSTFGEHSDLLRVWPTHTEEEKFAHNVLVLVPTNSRWKPKVISPPMSITGEETDAMPTQHVRASAVNETQASAVKAKAELENLLNAEEEVVSDDLGEASEEVDLVRSSAVNETQASAVKAKAELEDLLKAEVVSDDLGESSEEVDLPECTGVKTPDADASGLADAVSDISLVASSSASVSAGSKESAVQVDGHKLSFHIDKDIVKRLTESEQKVLLAPGNSDEKVKVLMKVRAIEFQMWLGDGPLLAECAATRGIADTSERFHTKQYYSLLREETESGVYSKSKKPIPATVLEAKKKELQRYNNRSSSSDTVPEKLETIEDTIHARADSTDAGVADVKSILEGLPDVLQKMVEKSVMDCISGAVMPINARLQFKRFADKLAVMSPEKAQILTDKFEALMTAKLKRLEDVENAAAKKQADKKAKADAAAAAKATKAAAKKAASKKASSKKAAAQKAAARPAADANSDAE